MKRILLWLSFLSLLASCHKNDIAVINDPAKKPNVSPVPAGFIQKILLEQFTSSNCGVCIAADTLRDYLVAAYPDRFYPVVFHVNDILADTTTTNPLTGINSVDSSFNPSGAYPSGMINRQAAGLADLSPANWSSRTAAVYGYIPNCGVAIDATINRGIYQDVEVHVGFSGDMPGDYRLHVYLIRSITQSSDSAYDQYNDFSMYGPSPDSTSSLYNLPYKINRYKHKYAVVRVMTEHGIDGDPIPVSLAHSGGEYIKTYTLSASLVDPQNLYVIAFVDKYATTADGHRMENVQKVLLGEAKDWN